MMAAAMVEAFRARARLLELLGTASCRKDGNFSLCIR
jgi:hypothetical protein